MSRASVACRVGPFQYLHFEEINSTQLYLRDRIEEIHEWICVTADTQTAGIGQYDRKWYSPPGVNLYMTLAFPFPPLKKPLLQRHLTQVTTVTLAGILSRVGLFPQIKWINDLLLAGKKCAGVLCELHTSQKGKEVALVGVGLNVNLDPTTLPADTALDQPVTSIQAILGHTYSRELILKALMGCIYEAIPTLYTEGFTPFYPPLRAQIAYLGQPVRLTQEDGTVYEGLFEALQPDGLACLRLADGEVKTFASGRMRLMK